MGTYVAKGCFAKLCNDREPTPVDKQPVVRMNRDTLYSVAVFDLTSPVTIVKPDTGKRFQSMVVINQDHYIPLVAYDTGTYTLTQEKVGTRNAIVLFRTFVDPNDPTDIWQHTRRRMASAFPRRAQANSKSRNGIRTSGKR